MGKNVYKNTRISKCKFVGSGDESRFYLLQLISSGIFLREIASD